MPYIGTYIFIFGIENTSDKNKPILYSTFQISVIFIILNLCTMILTLISSTLVIHLQSYKDEPMPVWIENLILYHLANFLCVRTLQNNKKVQTTKATKIMGRRKVYKIQRPNSAPIENNNKSRLTELFAVKLEGYQTHHDASNSIKEESGNKKREEMFSQMEQKKSSTEVNKWKSCSIVIERMFFLIWLMANLISIGLLVYLSTGNSHTWHSV